MKKIYIVIIIIATGPLSAFSQPDTLWTKFFGGRGFDYGCCVQQASDGGYAVSGFTTSFGVVNEDVYFIKTDGNGNELWSQTYGGLGDDRGICFQQCSDGSYIIAGCSVSQSMTFWDAYLVKIGDSGTEEWIRYYDWYEMDYFSSIDLTSDGGYIMAGSSEIYGGSIAEIFLVKTDGWGNQQWSQLFGGPGYDEGFSVQQTSDGGYIIAGRLEMSISGDYDICLIKTDALGNELWSQNFGEFTTDAGYCVGQTNDGGYIITGYFSPNYIDSDMYLLKTDDSGNEEWFRTYGGDDFDYGMCVQQTDDNGYIIVGATYSYGAGEKDIYIVKTDEAGNELWSQTFGGTDHDYATSVQQTSDGGYIVAGTTRSFGTGWDNVWLIRLAPETIPDITVTLTPFNPPIQIPANGGTFDFNIEIANNGVTPETVDIWTMVTLPDGSEFGPIINISDFMLNAGQSVDRNRTQNVPENAPAGDFAYHAYIGTYPEVVLAEDHFDFEKLSVSDGSSAVNDWICWGAEFGVNDQLVQNTPGEFVLYPPYPNPFNPETTISFELRVSSEVELTVFDITGREVASLVSGYLSLGYHEVVWNAEGLGSGVYFVRLDWVPAAESRHHTSVEKLLLVK